ncbi:MAG: hypothetical protein K2W85_08285 [Phycisphaerales bacterium]|nr:hypothetical protein [Phycisphaerales bacterium]
MSGRSDTSSAQSSVEFTAWFATLAAVWGFSEALLFFIVPDVLTTAGAVVRPRVGLIAAASALAGALLGGWAMHTWATKDVTGAASEVLRTPGATHERLLKAERQLRDHGAAGMLLGGISFIPYKLYGIASVTQGMSLPMFLLCSTLARGVRFTATTLLAGWIAHGPLRAWSLKKKIALHLAVWSAIYGVYFVFVA